jgi:phage terminase large subunit-like protein
VNLSALATATNTLARRAHADPLAYFRPTPPQLAFLSSNHPIRLLRAGNQLGKTWAGLADCIFRCLGSHPYTLVKAPPIEAWVVVVSWEQSLAVQQKLWTLLPKDAISDDCEFTPGKGFRGKVPIVRFKNGSVLRIRTVNQGALSLASATIDYVLLDEPCPENLWSELAARVLRQRGKIAITLTPIGLPLGWLKRLVEEQVVQDLHYPLTVDNTTPIGGRALLAQEDIDKLTAQILPQEVAQRIHGEWDSGWVEGRVFKMFDPAQHVKADAPVGEALIGVGIDHGTEAGAQVAVLTALVRDAGEGHPKIWVLDQVVSDGMTTPDQDAAAILGMLKRCGLRWENVDRWVGDRKVYGKKNGSLKSNAMLGSAFERALRLPTGSLPFRINTAYKPRGSVFEGYRVLSAAMLRGDFSINPRCRGLIDDLQKFDGREASEHKHSIDALRYCLELYTRRLYQPSTIRLG